MSYVRAYGFGLLVFASAALFTTAASGHAATLCVSQHSQKNCYSSISAAVAAASAGDTVQVQAGVYAESVKITKPVSLVGQNSSNTIINARGLSNGIYIDGWDAPGLSGVTVRGLTVEFANYEGILVQNASNVTLSSNTVRENDQMLPGGCPGLPPFETNEADDCGEGIHLMGVDHSIVAFNLVEDNSGGILVSDETAPNHDNVITKNTVQNNAYDCGITLASHAAYVRSGTPPLAFGVSHNTISDNDSLHNGFGSAQGGAGVGLFAPGPGNVMIDNSVVGNRLIGNSMPGVALHNHVFLPPQAGLPNPVLNDNAIVGNYIARNGPDSSTGTTVPTGISILGTTPVTGLVITGNIVDDESIDVAVNSASLVSLHLNNLDGNKVGVANLNSAGSVDATENWWGCSGGPSARGCSDVTGSNVSWTPWLTTPIQSN